MTPGATFEHRGQRYCCVGKLVHETHRGFRVELLRLESVCPECRHIFECTATRTAIKRGYLARRCREHRRPGAPVGQRRVRRKAPARTLPPPRMPARQVPRSSLAEMLS